MKTTRGSVLISAAMAAGVLAILIAGFLTYLSDEYNWNFRSHRWNQSFHLAEAAVETGIAEYNFWQYQAGTGFQSARGWTSLGGNSYSKTVANLADNGGNIVGTFYVKASNINTNNPTFQGVGTVTSGNFSGPSIARAVQVSLAPSPMFPLGLMSLTTIDMNGNNIYTDSYDSSNPTKSTGGQYDASKRQPNGNIGTDDTVINSVSIGNANIYGTVQTGVGGTVTMGPNGSIGPSFSNPDTTVSQAQSDGWIQSDFDVSIPDVTLPSGLGSATPLGAINSGTSLGGGDYQATSISLGGHDTLNITGNVRIYVSGASSISISGNGSINIATNASLQIYVAGSVSIAGNGIANTPGSATSLELFGLPTSTSWNVNGNGQWDGTVYAPEAALTIAGGGSQGDVSGAFVTKSITLSGHTNFHYDESLKKTGPVVGYVAASWQELRLVSGSWVP